MLETRTQHSGTGAGATWLAAPRVRLALVAGSLAVIAVTLAQWLLALYHDTHSIAGRYDFSSYYAAAYALRLDPHANIYDPAVLARAGAAAHVLVNPPLPYTYPPLFAILLSPFTLLSFRVLSRLWLFGNAALWLGVTVLLANEIRVLLATVYPTVSSSVSRRPPLRWLRDDPIPLLALSLACWLCLPAAPAAQTLLTGQINFLVLAPLALIPLLTRRGHERWVGICVALAAILKFTPALLLVYLLLRRRWQALIAALVALLALALVSVLVVGPGVTIAAIPQALHVGVGDADLGHNESLFAPLLQFVTIHAASLTNVATLLARLLTLALALLLGYRLWRGPRSADAADSLAENTGYGVALCLLLLLAPAAWVHHYVWALPAAALALGLAVAMLLRALGTTRWPRAAALLALTILACVALGWGLPHGWDTDPHPAVTTALGLPLWPLLLMLRPLSVLMLALLLTWWYARPDATA
ncbi:MAG: hypothetical protein OJF49_001241 [Ktedonobacterales bacterium]|jgi:alpha-1,2-mannosyltransferase|nr:MAG: hypothetical protein OJF49_001241 [Ktedonobacterales bacterium]